MNEPGGINGLVFFVKIIEYNSPCPETCQHQQEQPYVEPAYHHRYMVKGKRRRAYSVCGNSVCSFFQVYKNKAIFIIDFTAYPGCITPSTTAITAQEATVNANIPKTVFFFIFVRTVKIISL